MYHSSTFTYIPNFVQIGKVFVYGVTDVCTHRYVRTDIETSSEIEANQQFIHSVIHSFIHSFTHSFIHSFYSLNNTLKRKSAATCTVYQDSKAKVLTAAHKLKSYTKTIQRTKIKIQSNICRIS